MERVYVIDTNVLAYAAQALFAFQEHLVVLPEVVIEELDRFKREASERGANSREVIRILDRLSQQGDLAEGVGLNDVGGRLRIESGEFSAQLPAFWHADLPDNRILQICKGLQEAGQDAVLVSRDTALRIKASVIGLPAEDYRHEKVVSVEKQYTGRAEAYAAAEAINQFYLDRRQWLDPDCLKVYDVEKQQLTPIQDLVVNQFLVVRNVENGRHTVLGRFDGRKVVRLQHQHQTLFGLTPRSVGQIFMQECLMMDAEEAPVCIIRGQAGTGKTLFSLAAGLEEIMEQEQSRYQRMLICRPSVAMEDIGFLPGGERDKIHPYMRGMYDNLFTLLNGVRTEGRKERKQIEDTVKMLLEDGTILMEALAFQRGRSLHKYFFILDEMQNSTPVQAKTIITRCGMGTKIVILGDPEQIDNHNLSESVNGLVYAGEKMKGSPYCYQITMLPEECERSPVAADASQRMR